MASKLKSTENWNWFLMLLVKCWPADRFSIIASLLIGISVTLRHLDSKHFQKNLPASVINLNTSYTYILCQGQWVPVTYESLDLEYFLFHYHFSISISSHFYFTFISRSQVIFFHLHSSTRVNGIFSSLFTSPLSKTHSRRTLSYSYRHSRVYFISKLGHFELFCLHPLQR